MRSVRTDLTTLSEYRELLDAARNRCAALNEAASLEALRRASGTDGGPEMLSSLLAQADVAHNDFVDLIVELLNGKCSTPDLRQCL